ncbi:hypothetical protein HJFPF1_00326 [Paramyrothecium foliicola]|nr:hypothetical protein HJFPF1_00326 [Paramyrothecium foliicola]
MAGLRSADDTPRQSFCKWLNELEDHFCERVSSVGPTAFCLELGTMVDVVLESGTERWSAQSFIWDLLQVYHMGGLKASALVCPRPSDELLPLLPREVLSSVGNIPETDQDSLWVWCARFADQVYDTIRFAAGLPQRTFLDIFAARGICNDTRSVKKKCCVSCTKAMSHANDTAMYIGEVGSAQSQPVDGDNPWSQYRSSHSYPSSRRHGTQYPVQEETPDQTRARLVQEALDECEDARDGLVRRNLELAHEVSLLQQKLHDNRQTYEWARQQLAVFTPLPTEHPNATLQTCLITSTLLSFHPCSLQDVRLVASKTVRESLLLLTMADNLVIAPMASTNARQPHLAQLESLLCRLHARGISFQDNTIRHAICDVQSKDMKIFEGQYWKSCALSEVIQAIRRRFHGGYFLGTKLLTDDASDVRLSSQVLGKIINFHDPEPCEIGLYEPDQPAENLYRAVLRKYCLDWKDKTIAALYNERVLRIRDPFPSKARATRRNPPQALRENQVQSGVIEETSTERSASTRPLSDVREACDPSTAASHVREQGKSLEELLLSLNQLNAAQGRLENGMAQIAENIDEVERDRANLQAKTLPIAKRKLSQADIDEGPTSDKQKYPRYQENVKQDDDIRELQYVALSRQSATLEREKESIQSMRDLLKEQEQAMRRERWNLQRQTRVLEQERLKFEEEKRCFKDETEKHRQEVLAFLAKFPK